ncbi:MAG: hypothetical protein ACXADX_14620 [Candidatus Hodarchaeales archaeon]
MRMIIQNIIPLAGITLLLFAITGMPTGQKGQGLAEPTLEWKAAVGDSKDYKFLKVYDVWPPLEDEIRLDNGSLVNITYAVDTTYTVTITSINNTFGDPLYGGLIFAYTKGTYGEYTIAEGKTINLFKTTDNQTYWEEWAAEETDTSGTDYHDEYWVEGDMLYYHNYHKYGSIPGLGEGSVGHTIRKSSWKTGWVVHYYNNWTDADGTLLEEWEWQEVSDIPPESSSAESSEESSEDSGIPGFSMLPLFATMLIMSALYRRRKRETKTRH